MSATQKEASEMFVNEMGTMINDAMLVQCVMEYVRQLRIQQQAKSNSIEDIYARLDKAEQEAQCGGGIPESEARTQRHQFIQNLLSA